MFFSGREVFTVEDGVWKLKFPHCMWPVTCKATNFPGLKLPDICTCEPAGQEKAFCQEHEQLAIAQQIPVGLRDFIKHCGVSKSGPGKLFDAIT